MNLIGVLTILSFLTLYFIIDFFWRGGAIGKKCLNCGSRLTATSESLTPDPNDSSSPCCKHLDRVTKCLRCKHEDAKPIIYHGKDCRHY